MEFHRKMMDFQKFPDFPATAGKSGLHPAKVLREPSTKRPSRFGKRTVGPARASYSLPQSLSKTFGVCEPRWRSWLYPNVAKRWDFCLVGLRKSSESLEFSSEVLRPSIRTPYGIGA